MRMKMGTQRKVVGMIQNGQILALTASAKCLQIILVTPKSVITYSLSDREVVENADKEAGASSEKLEVADIKRS